MTSLPPHCLLFEGRTLDIIARTYLNDHYRRLVGLYVQRPQQLGLEQQRHGEVGVRLGAEPVDRIAVRGQGIDLRRFSYMTSFSADNAEDSLVSRMNSESTNAERYVESRQNADKQPTADTNRTTMRLRGEYL